MAALTNKALGVRARRLTSLAQALQEHLEIRLGQVFSGLTAAAREAKEEAAKAEEALCYLHIYIYTYMLYTVVCTIVYAT